MSYIVALTGGIGSGKSTIADLFAELGVPIVDADIIAKKLLSENSAILDTLFCHFGDSIKTAEGQLDRLALKQLIFKQPKEREWLNALLHPLIEKETRKQFNLIKAPYILWVCPLLIEIKQHNKADSVLLVEISRTEQQRRVMLRDNISLTLANNILASQLSNNERRVYASQIINNEQPINITKQEVKLLHQYYLKQAALSLILTNSNAG